MNIHYVGLSISHQIQKHYFSMNLKVAEYIFKGVIIGNSSHDIPPHVMLLILADKINLAPDITCVLPEQFF